LRRGVKRALAWRERHGSEIAEGRIVGSGIAGIAGSGLAGSGIAG
jgi:hypothetical protein